MIHCEKEQKDACLICGEALVYTTEQQEKVCAVCGRAFWSNAGCINGHFVCDACHSQNSLEQVISVCTRLDSKNPIEIAQRLFKEPSVHMHGPEHHVLAGASILTAYCNAGGKMDLDNALQEMIARGKQIPGGACGFWGCCGAALSCGISCSILAEASPLSGEVWGKLNLLTSAVLTEVGKFGGPRCCKRDSFLAIRKTAELINESRQVKLEVPSEHHCIFYSKNKECLKEICPFFPKV